LAGNAVYCDNSISAFKGAPRPAYERLLAAIKAGKVDVVIAWSHDRLNRRPKELERYVDVCEKAGISTYTVKAGHFDLTTPSGRAVARTLAAWASYEVETTIERAKASRLQAARNGLPVGGTRALGYEKDGMTIIPEEAAILRDIGQRIIAGESLTSITRDLNNRGIRTVRGNIWYRHRLNDTLSRKRYVGIREHIGNEYPAAWEPIFDPETFEAIQMALRARRNGNKKIGNARRYLLTGFAVCGLCGNKLTCSRKRRSPDPKQPLRQTYECRRVDAQENTVGCEMTS
jgi:site-specific DNA recombinase